MIVPLQRGSPISKNPELHWQFDPFKILKLVAKQDKQTVAGLQVAQL